MLGRSGDEVADVGGVDQAERADLAGRLGHALQRLERDSDRDQRRDAWLGIVTGVAAGPTRVAGRRLGIVAPARTAGGTRGGAAVGFLEQVEVCADA
jgi:hypothetical protein